MTKTHVSLLVYAEESEIIFNFTDHLSYQQVKQAISGVRYPQKLKRNVGKGLKHVKNSVLALGGRSGVPKIVISLQDRKSDDGIDAIAQELRANGIRVLSVGPSNRPVADSQRKEIAYKSNEDYVKTIAYENIDFKFFVESVKQSICKGKVRCSFYQNSVFSFPACINLYRHKFRKKMHFELQRLAKRSHHSRRAMVNTGI